MGLSTLKAENFRCLDRVDLEFESAVNVVAGANGSGKTSLLEAIYFLSRGRSFRAPRVSGLIQAGARELMVFGKVPTAAGMERRLGISAGAQGIEVRVDGRAGSAADAAAVFPVQIIESEVHDLVQGAPQQRRQFIDWGVFHVEHRFLAAWRRYRRALKQRNAALRNGAPEAATRAFDAELIESGLVVDTMRRRYIEMLAPSLAELSATLAGLATECHYRPGWAAGQSFEAAVAMNRERDRVLGSTQAGPHRAELRLITAGHAARHRISRGQQKLLAAAMVIAQSQHVSAVSGQPVTLLVDEPAAELDDQHSRRLVDTLLGTGLQLVLSTLDVGALPGLDTARMFHVERGVVDNLL